MDIYVEGRGQKSFAPNQIKLSFDFSCKTKTYESALTDGIKAVENYVDVLENLGFKKSDLKTKRFRVSEGSTYNETTRKWDKDGFVFSQQATLKFDYDMQQMSKLMVETSKCKQAPTYRIDFSIKDDKKVEEEVIALAIDDAKFQAEAIAKASGLKLTKCLKVSSQPFEGALVSETRYETGRCMAKASASESIAKVFVPEDVEVETSLYCLFLAE